MDFIVPKGDKSRAVKFRLLNTDHPAALYIDNVPNKIATIVITNPVPMAYLAVNRMCSLKSRVEITPFQRGNLPSPHYQGVVLFIKEITFPGQYHSMMLEE